MQAPSPDLHRVAVAALACAAALLAACSDSKSTPPSQLAARVNKSEISLHQVNHVLARQPGLAASQVDAASRQVLEGLIDQEVAVQQALDRKLDRDPAVMQALAAARREVLARAYADSIAGTAAKPTPADVKAYYDAKPAFFEKRRLYSLEEAVVQADAAQLEELRGKATQAKSIKDITDYLKDRKLPVRVNRTTAAPESLPAPLVDVLARGKPGQAMFLPAQGGARIVLIASVQDAPLALEAATPVIEQQLLNQRRRELVDGEVKNLRKAGQVEYLGRFAQAASAPAAAASASAGQAPTNPTTAAAAPADADAALVRRGLGTAVK